METQASETVEEIYSEQNPTTEDVIEQAGDLLGAISLLHELPVDFDGLTVSIIREPGTHRLQAVILSPTDIYNGEPFARYAVNANHVPVAKTRKLVLPS